MTIDTIISGGIENRMREIKRLVQELDRAIDAVDLERVQKLKDALGAQVEILYTLKTGTKVER